MDFFSENSPDRIRVDTREVLAIPDLGFSMDRDSTLLGFVQSIQLTGTIEHASNVRTRICVLALVPFFRVLHRHLYSVAFVQDWPL